MRCNRESHHPFFCLGFTCTWVVRYANRSFAHSHMTATSPFSVFVLYHPSPTQKLVSDGCDKKNGSTRTSERPPRSTTSRITEEEKRSSKEAPFHLFDCHSRTNSYSTTDNHGYGTRLSWPSAPSSFFAIRLRCCCPQSFWVWNPIELILNHGSFKVVKHFCALGSAHHRQNSVHHHPCQSESSTRATHVCGTLY